MSVSAPLLRILPMLTRLFPSLRADGPRGRWAWPAFVLLAFWGGMGAARAQAAAHFSYAITALGGGFSYPQGVAVDANGNVYVADGGNSAVNEIPAGCASSACVTTLGGGFSDPAGVAVDASGKVYVADYGGEGVKEMPAGCASSDCVTTLGGSLNGAEGVAVDASGNIYVADVVNNLIEEMPPGCASAACLTSLGGGFSQPTGVAVDANGNVYVADYENQAVKEMPAGCASSACVTTLLSDSNFATGVAVDASGNVYVASRSTFQVKEIPSGCASSACVTTLGGSLNEPFGVAVDASGNVYVDDDDLNTSVHEIMPHSVNFHAFAVGSVATPPLTLTFAFDSAGTIGAPVVLTMGAKNLDFADAHTGTCTTNGTSHSYSAGDTCTVDVTLAPTTAGARNGAVELVDNSGNVLATAYVYGTGLGPQVAFNPGVQGIVLATGLNGPMGMAVDGVGDVFIADFGNNRVVEVPAGGGPETTLGTGLNRPNGVAVDGAGNVFISDYSNGRVVEVPSGGGPQTTVGTGISLPLAVAVDGQGDVFIVDILSRVVKVPSGGGPQTTVGTGLNSPTAVAVDGIGDVFIADAHYNRVVEVPVEGGAQTTVATGLNDPQGVAVDGGGDIFIADYNNNRVLEVPSGGGPQTTVGSGLNSPAGVAVDAAGNIFIADDGSNRVLEVQRSQPPTLSFAATAVGSTSADSPQSIFFQNIGNQPLNGIPPGLSLSGAAFAQVAGPGSPADCTSSFSLAPGASCNLSISFTPNAAGALTGTAVFSDNALNNAFASQSLSLSGTGLNPAAATLSTAALAFGNQVDNTTSSTKTVTLTSSGTGSLNISGITITGANQGDFAQTNTCPASLAPSAKCTISVTYTPSILGAESASLTITDNASTSPQTVALTGTGIAPATLSATTLAFGNVGENNPSAVKTVTLTNNQTVALTVSSITTGNPDYTETDNCTPSVAAKRSCKINLTLTPTVLGADNGTLTVNDSASNTPQTAALTGTGIAPAALSATALAFGNVGENSPSSAKNVTLTNNLTTALTISSIAFTGANLGDFSETDTCNGSVKAKGTCVISVTFTPSALSAETATLNVNDSASNTPQTASLTGTGIAPATLSATTLAFGNVGENSPSAVKAVTLTNNQTVPLTVSNITTGNPDYTETDNCTPSLAAKSSCKINLTLTPTVLGADNGSLTVNDSASNTPQTASLTGTGIAPATLSATTLAFGNVGENSPSAVKTVTLTNNQTVALTVSSITTGNPDYTETDNCTPSLTAKSSCKVNLTLAPTVLGADNGTLTVNDSASNTPQTSALTGTGILPVTLSSTSLNFGKVTENTPSAVKTVTLTNNQTVALTITSITTGNPDYGETDNCTPSVAPKSTCTVSLILTPSVLGTDNGTLSVNDSASNTPQTAALTGAGK